MFTGNESRTRVWAYTLQRFHERSPQASHLLGGMLVLIGDGFGKGLARRLGTMRMEGISKAETDLDKAGQRLSRWFTIPRGS